MRYQWSERTEALVEHPKPKWWRLYAIVPVGLALLVMEAQLGLAEWEHKVAQIGVVILVVVLIALWAGANAVALAWADVDEPYVNIRDAGSDWTPTPNVDEEDTRLAGANAGLPAWRVASAGARRGAMQQRNH